MMVLAALSGLGSFLLVPKNLSRFWKYELSSGSNLSGETQTGGDGGAPAGGGVMRAGGDGRLPAGGGVMETEGGDGGEEEEESVSDGGFMER